MNRRAQRGVTTVEFALVGLTLLLILLGMIEFGRVVFTFNVLQEGARRAARVATVCSVANPAIAEAAMLLPLRDLSEENVTVEYLDASGAPLGDPANTDYARIEFVRVSIVDYTFDLFLPLPGKVINAREFVSTLPRESLGVPYEGAAPGC